MDNRAGKPMMRQAVRGRASAGGKSLVIHSLGARPASGAPLP
ncbi:hypothetical protein STTU_3779 [Streptomyces sp. Tu6071]|nr:hypothetical protein STTU_3779 [Streptomyces sp. Tu6071]